MRQWLKVILKTNRQKIKEIYDLERKIHKTRSRLLYVATINSLLKHGNRNKAWNKAVRALKDLCNGVDGVDVDTVCCELAACLPEGTDMAKVPGLCDFAAVYAKLCADSKESTETYHNRMGATHAY